MQIGITSKSGKYDGGTYAHWVITFILKSGNEIKCENSKNQQSSYEVSKNYPPKACEPCGVRSSA